MYSYNPARPVSNPTMIINNEPTPAPSWSQEGIIPAYGYELKATFEGTVYISKTTQNPYMLVRVFIHEALTRTEGETPIGFKCDKCFNPKVPVQTAIETATAYVVDKLHNSNRVNLYQLGQVGAHISKGWPVLYVAAQSDLNTTAKIDTICGVRVYAKVSGEFTWLNYQFIVRKDPKVFTGPDEYQSMPPQTLCVGFAPEGQLYSMDFLAHRENIMEDAMLCAIELLKAQQPKAKTSKTPLVYN